MSNGKIVKIEGLSKSITVLELIDLFAGFGEVQSVKIKSDYAIVEFESAKAADLALKVSGTEFFIPHTPSQNQIQQTFNL